MCDSLVATSGHTRTGATFFAKNSDRKLGECQPLLQLAAAVHPRGARVRCTHIDIPEVAETYRVMGHSPWWVWGFEHGVNEHGVAIGNQTVFSREPVEDEPGLIGMDLVRLGLERGRDAREALEAIASLLEAHGQGGSALAPEAAGYHNSFMIADPEEAWVMETSGRRWAARRTEMAALTNHMTLGSDWEIGSRDLDSFARRESWWQEKGRVDVASAYRHPQVPGRISEGRLRRSRELLTEAHDEIDAPYLQGVLRDHLDGGVAPPPGATPEDERYFTLCMHSEPVGTTTASLVAALPSDRRGPWPVWVSFGTPCTGTFLPVYLAGVIPDLLARGGASPEIDSAWWAFHALSEAASADFARHTPFLRREWAAVEDRIDLERRGVESSARTAAVSGDEDEAARILTDFMQKTACDVVDRARALRESIEAGS
jgi:dipeptidase